MNFYYPEKTQIYIITVTYNCVYLYSKLQILLVKLHNELVKYEQYNQMIYYLKDNLQLINSYISSIATNVEEQFVDDPIIVLDFVINNQIEFSCNKDEILDEATNKKEVNIVECDFVIINGEDNLKKIIKYVDLKSNGSVFQMVPFMYKPILCQFLDDEDKVIKIEFCSNEKSYDFLVVGNCFDKKFLTYFMKNFYDVEVKDKYILKILDHNVNTITLEGSDILKLENHGIIKIETDKN